MTKIRPVLQTSTAYDMTISGAQRVFGDDWNNGGVSGGTIEISIFRSQDHVGPEGIWFDTTVSGFPVPAQTGIYDPSFHEIYYVWDFDTPGKTFTSLQNVPDEWKNANVGYGAHVVSTFDPGTYTVRVTAIHPTGVWATNTVTFTVQDPDVVYPGAQTIFVSPASDWTNAPSGAQQTTTLQLALGLQAGSGIKHRIQLNRDETHIVSARTIVSGNYENIYIAAGPGAGAKPILTPTVGMTSEMVVSNTDFQGDWRLVNLVGIGRYDATTETSTHTDGITASKGFAVNSKKYALNHGCSGSGFGLWISRGSKTATATNGIPVPAYGEDLFIYSDYSATNWWNFAAYGSGNADGLFAAVGASLKQDPNAMMGGGGKNNAGANLHGSIRIQDCLKIYLDAMEMGSRNTWLQTSTILNHQPTLRMQTNSASCKCNVSRLVSENAPLAMGPAVGQNTNPMNTVMDKVIGIGGPTSKQVFNVENGAVTVRNFLSIQPNVGVENLGHGQGIKFTEQSNYAENALEPSSAYNVTVVNLSDDVHISPAYYPVNDPSVEFNGGFLENYVFHTPNATGGDVSFMPLTISAPLWAPYGLGFKWNEFHSTVDGGQTVPAQTTMLATWNGLNVATPIDTIRTYAPASGSSAYQSATGHVAMDDLFGTPRYDPITKVLRATASKGAIEPVA